MNKDKGFVTLNRKIMDWEWWSDDAIFRFFAGLIMLANYQDGQYKGKTIKRGSFVTSMPNLCAIFQASDKKIRRCLKCLVETGEITDVPTNKDRLITIVNYEKYQSVLPLTKRQVKGKNKSKDKREDNEQVKGKAIKQYISNDIYKKENKVSVAPTGQTDTVKKEAPPSAVTPEGEPPAAFDYEKIDWHIIQVFEGDEGRDLVYGHIPIRSVRRFAKAQGIDDYTASDFHSAFKRSKTPFPRDWEKLFVRYSRADSKKQDEFESRLLNGEYIEKWTE